MQCRDVEEVLEQDGLAPLPEAARMHVARCPHCQGYLADLETIVSTAYELPAEVEPPSRVWTSLLARLESEGIMGEKEKIGIGAGAGAIIGAIIGGAKGALAGILIGGGGTIAATEGTDVELPVGTVLRVRIDAPLNLAPQTR